MASIITCAGCGMQFDGSSLKPGVQFKCTGCGQMVVVGAAAPTVRGTRKVPGKAAQGGRATAGVATASATATAPRAPTRNLGARPVAGRPMPGARGQQAANAQQQGMPMGTPRKKDNTTMFVFVGIGVVLVGIVIAVVVGISKPSPQQEQQKAQEESIARQKEETRKKDEETAKRNKQIKDAFDGALAMGPKIAEALSAATDGGYFKNNCDWLLMSTKKQEDIAKNKDFLRDPLYCSGAWEKVAKGEKFVYTFNGKDALGSDGLQARVLWYFDKVFQGKPAEFEKAASEHDKAALTWKVGPKSFIGKKISIKPKESSKSIYFYCGCEDGTGAAPRIIWIEDGGALKAIQGIEMPHERVLQPGPDDPQNPTKDPEPDPKDPIVGTRPDPDPDPEDPPVDPDLPKAEKTGVTPSPGKLTNVLRSLRDGDSLDDKQVADVQDATVSGEEKKKFIGAAIDLLFDMREKGNRQAAEALTYSMVRIFMSELLHAPEDYRYEARLADLQENDRPLRCWYEFYTKYK